MDIILKINDKEFVIPPGITLLGRGEEADITLDSKRVSSTHARLIREGDQVFLEDLDSKNGTIVNGQKLTARRELLKGDNIKFGDLEAMVLIPAGPGAAPAVKPGTPAAAVARPLPAPAPAAPVDTAAREERSRRAMSRNEMKVIKYAIAAVIFVVLAGWAYSYVKSLVPEDLAVYRKDLTAAKAFLDTAVPGDAIAANTAYIEKLEPIRLRLANPPTGYPAEAAEAAGLLVRADGLLEGLRARNAELAQRDDAGARLAGFQARFDAGLADDTVLAALEPEVLAFRAEMTDTPYAADAASLAAQVGAARLTVARERIAAFQKDITLLAGGARYGAALARLDEALAMTYPAGVEQATAALASRRAELLAAADADFSRAEIEARALADKEQYGAASERIRSVYDQIGIAAFVPRRDILLGEIEKVRGAKLEEARKQVEVQLKTAGRAFDEWRFDQAHVTYAEVAGRIVNPDLKEEVNLRLLTARVFRDALDDVIAWLNKQRGFDLSRIGDMSGSLSEANRAGMTVQVGDTPITITWTGLREPEFRMLMRQAAAGGSWPATFACGLLDLDQGLVTLAIENIDKARAMDPARAKEFAPLVALVQAAADRERAATEAKKAETPVAAAAAVEVPEDRPVKPGPGLRPAVMGLERPRLFMR
ncbi:MAG: FHA domain-containing protein [Planctomycetota bacterium]